MGECDECDKNCTTCEKPGTKCLTCMENGTLSGSDVCECNTGFYKDTTGVGAAARDICVRCPPACTACTDASTCSTCDTNATNPTAPCTCKN